MKINRKQYRRVKKMDRQEMDNFVRSIYRSGFKDGSEEGYRADFKIELVNILENTKGIGPKLFERIMSTAKGMIEE